MKQIPVKVAISVAAVAAIVARLFWPGLKVDAVTLGLLVLAVLPWLAALIKSAEFPGGWKVEFQDVQSAGAKVSREAATGKAAADLPRPSYLEISDKDPNLALVGLRIEIEKRLRDLAKRHGIPEQRSLMSVFEQLRRLGVLNDSSVSGFQELVMAGNQAAHGAQVDLRAAAWAIDYGPQMLAALDAKLQG